MINKKALRSDSGYALGLVLIFVMAVGAVLGSVMMVTQLSSDAQGRGVDQLTASNAMAQAVSDVISTLSKESYAGYAVQIVSSNPNCGLPTSLKGVDVFCTVNSDPKQPNVENATVSFRDHAGKFIEKSLVIATNPITGTQSVTGMR
jgi:hypothetical protein